LKTPYEIIKNMENATGTERYHMYSAMPGYPVATDGAYCLAKDAECFWLLDLIGRYQSNKKLDRDFQVWELEVNQEHETGVLRGYNDTEQVIEHELEYTDFPLDKVTLWLMDGVILLPSEY